MRSLFIEEFFKKFQNDMVDDLNIDPVFFRAHLVQNPALSWEFFQENPEFLEENYRAQYRDDDSLGPTKKVSFNYLCKNSNIPEQFFEANVKKCNFRYLLLNPSISEDFVKKYWNRIEDADITNETFKNPAFSFSLLKYLLERTPRAGFEAVFLLNKNTPRDVAEHLLVKYADEMEFCAQSQYLGLQQAKNILEYSLKNDQKIVELLFQNQSLPWSLFEESYDAIMKNNTAKKLFLSDPRLSLAKITKIIGDFDFEDINDENIDLIDDIDDMSASFALFENPNLTVRFVENFLKRRYYDNDETPCVFFLHLARNKGLPWQFFEKHLREMFLAIDVSDVDVDFFYELDNDLKMNLSSNPSLPISFFNDHPTILHIAISTNRFIYQFALEERHTENEIIEDTVNILSEVGKDDTLPNLVMRGIVGAQSDLLRYRAYR